MGFDMETFKVVFSNALLFLLVFGIAGTVDTSDFKRQFRNKTGILVGLGCQFFVMPFMGFVCCKIFSLAEEHGIILLVVTSSPGGSFSNWWCSLFNTDLSLSVAMTTASTFAGMGMLPMNLAIYITAIFGVSVGVDWGPLLISVAIVISGITCGLTASHKKPDWRSKFNIVGTISGVSMILFSLMIMFFPSTDEEDDDDTESDKDDDEVTKLPWTFYVAVALPCVLGILISLFISSCPCFKLSKPERSAVCVECCFQNIAIAQVVAISMYSGQKASSALRVPFIYGAVEVAVVGIFCFCAWKMNWTFAPRSDPFWKVVSENYQEVAHVHRKRNWSVAHIQYAMDADSANVDGALNSQLEAPMHPEESAVKAGNELERTSSCDPSQPPGGTEEAKGDETRSGGEEAGRTSSAVSISRSAGSGGSVSM